MTCASCGAENRPGAKFCTECGASLVARCPACGAATGPGAKFCADCGARLGAAGPGGVAPGAGPADGRAIAPGHAGPSGIPTGAERRLVTVLFLDLAGSTALADGRDPEVTRDFLSRYFDAATEIVRRYGGTVEKFIGDAVMALWGAPTAHEDDAERAVRAGLDLVALVPTLGSPGGVALQARVGILTGEAAVTVGATNQGLVAGDLVNTAARLQALAVPGTVVVGESTRLAAAGAITFEPLGEAQLRGKAVPVVAHRALRVVAKVRGAGRNEGLEPPFVGRDVEFRLVRETYHAVARDRRARLVSITGEAGVGKSRLAWEFSKYTDGLADGMFWHDGRSPAYGEGISFWALGEMVRKRCGLAEADDDATTRARVGATLERHLPDAAERPQVEACLLALLGVDDPPPGGRERLFAGWRTFFERLAAEDPVVLVFEDLHWADDGLLDFVESLLEWSQSYPIYVLTLARPELLERRPSWGAGRNAASLPLGPLSDEAMHELLAGLVPGLPESAARSILERAGGMPLYAVETVRMLLADGRLEPAGDGTYLRTGDLAAIDVPPSLHALIAARLDGLPPADRTLVQDASVLGQTFSVAALASVADTDETALGPRLRSLIARDLLALDTDPRSPERGQYGFVQALIREVAYGTLAKRDRRARHLAAARYFEALGDEELSGALATHYLAAYEASTDDQEAQALAGQARIALRAAAARARSLGAVEQAGTFLESAARLPGEALEQLALLETAATIARDSSRYRRAEALADEIVGRAIAAGDRATAARATALRIEATAQQDEERALLDIDRALEAFADLGDEDLGILRIRMLRARIAIRIGRHREAVEITEAILAACERTQDESLVLTGLITRGAALPSVGRPLEGLVLLEGVLRRAEASGLEVLVHRARINLAVIRADDDVRGAREIAAAGFDEAMARGLRGYAAFFGLNASEYDLHLGDLDHAHARCQALFELELEGADRATSLETQLVLRLLGGLPHEEVERELTDLVGSRLDSGIVGLDARIWAALVEGDGRTTTRLAMEFAARDELNAPMAYLRAVIGAAMSGDVAAARAARDGMAALDRWGRWVQAVSGGIGAIALGVEGARDEAAANGAAAAAAFRTMGVRLDESLVALGVGLALRRDAVGRELLVRARDGFAAIGTAGLARLVDRLAPGLMESGDDEGPAVDAPPRSLSSDVVRALPVGEG